MTFRFTISGLATFLGKSPVTIRAWERKGLVSLPRVGTNRALSLDDIREVADIARTMGRINDERFYYVSDALGALSVIEQENG